MTRTIAVDTNIIARFLLADHPQLHAESTEIFKRCQDGETRVFVDPIIIAETVWLLSSYYQQSKAAISKQLVDFLTPDWIICSAKNQLLSALDLYQKTSFNFVDCWLATICRAKKIQLTTFDASLNKLAGNS